MQFEEKAKVLLPSPLSGIGLLLWTGRGAFARGFSNEFVG